MMRRLRKPESKKNNPIGRYLVDQNVPQLLDQFFADLRRDLLTDDFAVQRNRLFAEHKRRIEYFCHLDLASPPHYHLPVLRCFLSKWDELLGHAQQYDVAFTVNREIGSSEQSKLLLDLSESVVNFVSAKYPGRAREGIKTNSRPMNFDQMADFTQFILSLGKPEQVSSKSQIARIYKAAHPRPPR